MDSITSSKSSMANSNATAEGLIEDIDNGEIGDSDTSYTYLSWSSDGKMMGVLDFVIQNTTVTIEATQDPLPDVKNGSAKWVDVTELITGKTTLTDDHTAVIDTPIMFSRLRFKRVTTNATNAFELRVTYGNN